MSREQAADHAGMDRQTLRHRRSPAPDRPPRTGRALGGAGRAPRAGGLAFKPAPADAAGLADLHLVQEPDLELLRLSVIAGKVGDQGPEFSEAGLGLATLDTLSVEADDAPIACSWQAPHRVGVERTRKALASLKTARPRQRW